MPRLWNPYAQENIINPYLMYDRMRKEAPVFKAQTGEWIITRYEDVFNLISHKDLLVGNKLEWMKRQLEYLDDDRVDFQSIVSAMNSFLVLLNPPEHTKVRSLVSEAWSDQDVESTIQDHIHQLTKNLSKHFDLIDAFALPLPVMTICSIMGIEIKEYKKLKGLSEQMIQSFNLYSSLKELATISKAAKEFIQFFDTYIQHRKQQPGNDLVSKIISCNNQNLTGLSDEELISICIFLFVAGEETTVNLIGNGMLALLHHRPIWEEIVSEPALSAVAVNEILRYDAPVQLVGRIASCDFELNGHQIPKNSTVTLAIGAANRDPEKYINPNQFSLNRSFKQHLAFGRGKHFCLGSWLAKKQGELAIKALAKQFPKIQMKRQEIQWNNHLAVRGISSLKVFV